MTNTTQTLLAINTAVLSADGWYDVTTRHLGKFCTEALVDAAESCLAGMTLAKTERFAYSVSRAYRKDREWALNALCSWAHVARMRAWSASYEAARTAAVAEFPTAIAELGASL